MMEKNIRERLSRKKILIMAHMVLGYPSFEDNRAMLEQMQRADVDLIELQFPFSEPTADGPLFVKANQLSILKGTTVEQCFEFMQKASGCGIPLLMMGYYNLVFVKGEEAFCWRLSQCGAQGAILPDVPVQVAGTLETTCEKHRLDLVQIMVPNSSPERRRTIAEHSRGFIYCVARKGVTGGKTSFAGELETYLREVREITDLPLAVGFGVRERRDIEFLSGKADIAIVGSAALQAYEEGGAKGMGEFFGMLAKS